MSNVLTIGADIGLKTLGKMKENKMDYVKDGTLTIQARTIKEVNSIDRVVVYADGCQREYLMPLPTIEKRKEGHNLKAEYPSLYKCSECGWECWDTIPCDTITFNFCPNCGARMKGAK